MKYSLFFSYWTECSSAGDPSRKTACVFKNPENTGMVRKISFQAKSYLFSLHEMFKNSGSVIDLIFFILYINNRKIDGSTVNKILL